jgi:diadenosine tetraphosphatase ApaH/serine/threonine PP2A family protein phosphatase
MVLGQLGFQRCVHAGIRAAMWTRREMSQEARQVLAALPRVRQERGLVICHAHLDDLETYVSTPARAHDLLRRLEQLDPAARLIVCGHTHEQLLVVAGEPSLRTSERPVSLRGAARALVNPGSVGQSRDGELLARYARYDDVTGEVGFCAVSYPHEQTIAKLRTAGLVPRVTLLPPTNEVSRRWQGLRTRWARHAARAQT